MPEQNKSGLSPGALSTGVGQAIETAAKMVGNIALQGVDAGVNAKTSLAWLDEWIEPWRQQLGGLSFLLPRFFQRANPAEETEHNYKLLFKATDKPFPDTVQPEDPKYAEWCLLRALQDIDGAVRSLATRAEDSSSGVAITLATRKAIGTCSSAAGDFSKAANLTKALHKLLKTDGRRTDLPELIEELKHEIRANRQAGLQKLHEELRWVFEYDAKKAETEPFPLDDLWTWNRELTQVLGETCFAEMLRYDDNMAAVPPRLEESPTWSPDTLVAAFKLFGFHLSNRLTVYRERLRNKRMRYVLFDHRNDWVFYFWDGTALPALAPTPGSGQRASYGFREFEVEVFGPRVGRDYEIGRPAIAKFKLPLDVSSVSKLPSPVGPDLKLPVRVFEARMGMAVWNVQHRVVQEYLDSIQNPNDVRVRAWDIGATRTPVALFVVQYRDGDLGEYYEMGLGCFVYPRKDPSGVGMFVVGDQLAVSTDEAKAAGYIWGYPKKLIEEGSWKLHLDDQFTRWVLRLDPNGGSPLAIHLSLPRGGHRASPLIPLLSYTRKFERWHRTVLMRQGTGESLRLGGRGVELEIEGFDDDKTYSGIVRYLREFGVTTGDGKLARKADYSLWTEHMNGELGVPELLRVNAQEEEEGQREE